jgi:hypothetical protein
MATVEKRVSDDKIRQPVSPVDSIQVGDTEQAQYTEKGIAIEDVDEALKFLGAGERTIFSPKQNKKLLRKIGQC